MNPSLKQLNVALCVAIVWAGILNMDVSAASLQVKQSSEVIEAYRLCETFEHVLGENLDFDRAFEATFPRNKALRRAIAIAGGEFSDHDLASVDDELIINAYKRRMELFYLVLILAGPSAEEAPIFFPPEIKDMLQHQVPVDPRGFRNFVLQLDQDVARFRAHIDRLGARYPAVADRIREFKSGLLAAKFQPPGDRKIEPIIGYYRSDVLRKDEPYYEIGSYTIIKEDGRMRIIGIRFITRLF